MVRELSADFAERVRQVSPEDPAGQVDLIYQIALSRTPTTQERQLVLATLHELTAQWAAAAEQDDANEDPSHQNSPEAQALANICHVVMNSAEFLTVD